MSIESMSTVLHHSKAKGSAKLLLLGIANHEGDGGAWPSIATLAIYLNVHPRNVQRALTRLEELHEVEVWEQAGGTLISHASDWLRPNRYEVRVECPEGCAGGANHRPRPGWKRTPQGDYVPVDNGVANTPPGGDSATRAGGDSATQTTHLNQPPRGSASTTGVTPPCVECSAPDLPTCSRRQAKLRPEDRHTYTPRPWKDRA